MVVKQKILITGADGQLGSELRELSKAFPQFEYIFTTRAELPLDDEEELKTRLTEYLPQYIIHAAAYTAVDKAESDSEMAFKVNATAAGVIAAFSKEHAARLFYISTDYVFDGTAKVPYKETDTTNPLTVYGASKLAGEQRVLQIDEEAIVIRTAWVFSSYGKNFVKTMLRLMSEKPSISVVNDQVGSPTYAADLAQVLLDIIAGQHWVPGIYHYSNEGIISWFDFASEIRTLSGSACEVKPIAASAYPTPAKRPAWSVLDKSKIKETFGVGIGHWDAALKTCLAKIAAGG